MVVGYLALIEVGKRIFYRTATHHPPTRRRHGTAHAVRRRATRFSSIQLIKTHPGNTTLGEQR